MTEEEIRADERAKIRAEICPALTELADLMTEAASARFTVSQYRKLLAGLARQMRSAVAEVE